MRNQKQIWLNELLAQIPDENRDEVETYLTPLLKRCHSKSRKTFWVWARIQLAKNHFVGDISELRLPPETVKPHQREGFTYVINGDVALIDVANETGHAVWRVPLAKLQWALSMYPVSLVRIPELVSIEAEQLRRIKRRLRTRKPFMTPVQIEALEGDIAMLTALGKRLYTPLPRFMLRKYVDGVTIPLHRIFLDAGRDDQVKTVDGDLLNFANATYTRIEQPVAHQGLIVVKGDRPPTAWHETVTCPNLYICNSPAEQKDFEDKFLQAKLITWDGVETNEFDVGPLRVQPNADYLPPDEGEPAPIEEPPPEPDDAVELDGKPVEGLAEQAGYGSEYLGLAPEPDPEPDQTNLFEISAQRPSREAIKGRKSA